MATNISVGNAFKTRANVMHVNAYENVDFEEIVLTCQYPRYKKCISHFSYIKSPKNLLHFYLNFAHNK